MISYLFSNFQLLPKNVSIRKSVTFVTSYSCSLLYESTIPWYAYYNVVSCCGLIHNCFCLNVFGIILDMNPSIIVVVFIIWFSCSFIPIYFRMVHSYPTSSSCPYMFHQTPYHPILSHFKIVSDYVVFLPLFKIIHIVWIHYPPDVLLAIYSLSVVSPTITSK